LQLFLRIGPGRIAQHPFLFAQLAVQAQRVIPVEPGKIWGILGFQGHLVLHAFDALCARKIR